MSEDSSLSFADFMGLCETQLHASGVPRHLWPRLHEKLEHEIFDAGEYFQMLCEEPGEEEEGAGGKWSVVAIQDIRLEDPNCVFLIDHAWTFRPHDARDHLRVMPSLLDRMKSLLAIGRDEEECAEDDDVEEHICEGDHLRITGEAEKAEKTKEAMIDRVLRGLWLHAQTYSIRSLGEGDIDAEMPVWYIPDELGCRIAHHDSPSFRVLPFCYVPMKTVFSLLFPVKPIVAGEEVTRDYCDTPLGRAYPEYHLALLHPWQPVDFSEEHWSRLPFPDSFFTSGREMDDVETRVAAMMRPRSSPILKVYADDCQLLEHLKTVQWERVDNLEQADVVWLRRHFHNFRELNARNPACLINQFPFESNLTVKDLLAAAIQSHTSALPPSGDIDEWSPPWFATTYNLHTELLQFIAHFQRRELRNLNNVWIVKPWNLARGLDMHVTDNLMQIIRLVETGPKVVVKYIDDPVLFRREDLDGDAVKFDLRYIVLLRGLKPTSLYIYNHFWLRFAQRQFSLEHLDDVATHFTVFNYTDKAKVLNMKCDAFIEQFQRQYPALQWTVIQAHINKVIKEAFEIVSTGEAPRAMLANRQSRAIYGVDMMLKWSNTDEQRQVQPVLLEVNFMPDCERACQFYPDFADTVFRTLFDDASPDEENVTLI